MDEKNAFNTDLDPEVIKIRDKIISKIGDKPLEEVNSIIKKLLNESKKLYLYSSLLSSKQRL